MIQFKHKVNDLIIIILELFLLGVALMEESILQDLDNIKKKESLWSFFSSRASEIEDVAESFPSTAYQVIEQTRLRYDLTITQMATLLGLTRNGYRRCMLSKKMFSMHGIIRFCYIFNYDIEGILTHPMIEAHTDEALLELASLFGSLNDESLRDVASYAESKIVAVNQFPKRFSKAVEAYIVERNTVLKEIAKNGNKNRG